MNIDKKILGNFKLDKRMLATMLVFVMVAMVMAPMIAIEEPQSLEKAIDIVLNTKDIEQGSLVMSDNDGNLIYGNGEDFKLAENPPPTPLAASPGLIAPNTITTLIQPGTTGKDSCLRPSDPNGNYGGWPWITVNFGDTTYGMIEFDISAAANITGITKVELGIFHEMNIEGTDTSWGVYQVNDTWDENTVTWTNRPSTSNVSVDTINYSAGTSNTWRIWNITSIFMDWQNGTLPNNGLFLRRADWAYSSIFHSSSDNGNALYHPYLLIHFAVDYFVSLEPDKQYGVDYPGNTVQYVLTAQNQGDLNDTFDLSASGNAWPVTFRDITDTIDITDISVPADQNGSFIVNVDIPGFALPGDFDIANITATSQGNISVSDIAQVITNTPNTVPWFDGFEAGWNAWSTEVFQQGSPETNWEIGDPMGAGPGAAYNGSNCAGTNIDDQYYSSWMGGLDMTLTSPYVELGISPQILNFQTWYDMWYGCHGPDAGIVEISTGVGWNKIDPIGGYPDNSGAWGNCFTGTNTGWEFYEFDLSAYAGQVVQVRFHFMTNSCQSLWGWYVDDIYMGSPPSYRVYLEPDTQRDCDFPGNDVDYLLTANNTGANDDTYDLSSISTWPVTFFDLGMNPIAALGPVTAGNSMDFIARVSIPGGALPGEFDIADITATSQGNGSVSDTAQVTTSTPFTDPWIEDFESGAGLWYEDVWVQGSTETHWEVGNPSGAGPGTAFSGTDCVGTNIDNQYFSPFSMSALSLDIGFTSPFVELAAGPNILNFYTWYDIYQGCDNVDGGFVEIDNGTGWTQIWPTIGYPVNGRLGAYNTDGFSGISTGWEFYEFDLTAHAGEIVQIRLHFAASSCRNDWGWYVDDIYMGSPPLFNFNLVPGQQRDWGFPGNDVDYIFTVNNTGANNDTYDLSSISTWPVTFFDMGMNPIAALGPVTAGNSMDFIARVSIPGGALPGEFDIADITATSQGNGSVSETVQVQTDVPYVTNWLEEFESGWNTWTNDIILQGAPPTNWEIGDPMGTGPGTAYTGSNCAGTNIDDTYYSNWMGGLEMTLTSPYVELGMGTQVLNFQTWYNMWYGCFGPDGGFVEISTGVGWNKIDPIGGYPENSMAWGNCFSGNSLGWEFYEFDISAYAGQVVQVRFHFITISCQAEWGWYLDDVYMGSLPQYRVDLVPDTQAGWGFPGNDVDYILTANNTGANNDTYDLSSISTWPVTFFDMGMNPIVAIGPVTAGNSMDFIARVSIPGGALPGEFDIADIIATSQGNGSVSDTAQIRTQVPLPTPWFEGFETGWGAWTTEVLDQGSPETIWEMGDPMGAGPGTAYNGSNCAGTNIDDNYYNGHPDITLISPFVELGAGQQVLDFYTWYNIRDGCPGTARDGGFVEIDNGTGWTQIWPTILYPDSGVMGGYFTDGYSGDSAGWEFYEFNLTAYAGQVVQVRFHFASDFCWIGYSGWYLDDIYMGSPSEPWATANGPISIGTIDDMPTITYNYGNSPTSVDIYWTDDNGTTWNYWGTDATVDGSWAPISALPASGTYYWNVKANGTIDEAVPTTPADVEAGPYVLDLDPPSIISTNPADGAIGVPIVAGTYAIEFDEPMAGLGTPITNLPGIAWAWDGTGMWLNGTYAILAPGTTYYVNLTGQGFEDICGNALIGDMDKEFTTSIDPWATATGPTSTGDNDANPMITYNFGNSPTSIDIYWTNDSGTTWYYWGTDLSIDGSWTGGGPLPGSGNYSWSVRAMGSVNETIPSGPADVEAGPYLLDADAPFIVSTTPADTTIGVSIVAGTYIVQFSEPMDSMGFSTTLPGASGTMSADQMWLNITYTALSFDTIYYVNISATQDLVGNNLIGDRDKEFTTEMPPAPWATATDPISAGTNDDMPTILYNYGNSPTSVDIYWTDDGGATWNYWGTDATVDGSWTPISALPASGTYDWNAKANGSTDELVPTTPADVEAGSYVLDIDPPSIISTDPVDGAIDVSVAAGTYVIEFNEPMAGLGTPLTGLPGIAWAWDGTGMWLNGTYAILAPGTTYYVNLTGQGFEDICGNALIGDMDKEFTTNSGPWATATGSTSTGTTDDMPTITYTYGNTPTSVDIYWTDDGGATWNYWGTDATVDGSWTPITALPASGTYDWNVKANGTIDEAVPTTPADVEAGPYVLDLDPPTVVPPTTPAGGAIGVILNQDIIITFDEAMNTGSVTYTVESGFVSLTGLASAWSLGDTVLTITHDDFAATSDYWVNITAGEDLVGNLLNPTPYEFDFTTGSTVGATADATDPIGGPTNDDTISINYTTTGTPGNVLLYYTTNNGANWTLAGNDTTPLDGTFDWTIPASGTYAWMAVAEGGSSPEQNPPFNGTAPEAGDYIYDGDAPTVDSTNPNDGANNVALDQVIEITFSEAMDTGTVTYTVWPAITGIVTGWSVGDTVFTISHDNFAEGVEYFVNITAGDDLAGNSITLYSFSFTSEVLPVPDTNPPTSSVSAMATYHTSDTFNVIITASDTGGSVTEVELWYRYEGGSWALFNTYSFSGSSKTISFTSPDGDGFYEFYSKAKDDSNNWESAPSGADASTTVDTTGPSVNAGSDVHTNANITQYGTGIDTGSGIAVYSWTVTSGPGTITFGSPDQNSTDINADSDGTYVIRLTVTDNAGNTAFDEFTLKWDTTPPTVTGTPTGENVTTTINITITFNEPVNKAEAEDGFSISPSVDGTFIWNGAGTVMTFVPDSALTAGTVYIVSLEASNIMDILGNQMTNDTTWSFTTEADIPTVTGSLEGYIVDENGNGISGVMVSILGTELSVITDENGYYSFENVPVGNHTLSASKSGYRSESIEVEAVEDEMTTAPQLTLLKQTGPDNWWWLIFLLIGIGASILMIYGTKRRKKNKEEHKEMEAEEEDIQAEEEELGYQNPPPPPPPQD